MFERTFLVETWVNVQLQHPSVAPFVVKSVTGFNISHHLTQNRYGGGAAPFYVDEDGATCIEVVLDWLREMSVGKVFSLLDVGQHTNAPVIELIGFAFEQEADAVEFSRWVATGLQDKDLLLPNMSLNGMPVEHVIFVISIVDYVNLCRIRRSQL